MGLIVEGNEIYETISDNLCRRHFPDTCSPVGESSYGATHNRRPCGMAQYSDLSCEN